MMMIVVVLLFILTREKEKESVYLCVRLIMILLQNVCKLKS